MHIEHRYIHICAVLLLKDEFEYTGMDLIDNFIFIEILPFQFFSIFKRETRAAAISEVFLKRGWVRKEMIT